MKILVVDDDPVILDLLPTVLRQEGHHDISVAASGDGALDILSCSEEIFDVLILDIMMPGMDGIELCTNIREMQSYINTPIIMLTARSDTCSIESAFAAGANDYITKPFDIKSIGSRIQIAERMMNETCKIVRYSSLIKPLPEPFGTHEFDVGDPVRISGLKQHTDPFSLGNYLSQLARKKVDQTSVFALKINAFEAHYDYFSSKELLLIISELSNAIAIAADNKRLLNACVGSGIFICIATDDVLGTWLAMEERIDTYLKQSELLRGADLSVDVTVTLGRPFRPNASKTKRVRPTFDRAVSLLSKRIEVNAMAR